MSSSQYQGRVSRVLAVAPYAAVLFVFAPHWAHAQAVQSLDQQEQRDRAQREAQARQQQQAQPDVRLDSGHATDFRRADVRVERCCARSSSTGASIHVSKTRLLRIEKVAAK
ncbi:hypothetical protein L2Y96_21220 [Luteibacter aegosomaticola]|uniref:hypothetical protein n=1 Tax=Luteibacter aegosomaticola TaxID=2911538 RepID=UPI001FFB225E|nr:hypothetical protein [Luteibacter aegosomaticola]UPG89879.1 hypothetical protein L2Y96_21220 [Luteibacter aegosomaticola]